MVGVVACSPAKPEPTAQPAVSMTPPEPDPGPAEPAGPEPVQTGHECATAEATCDGGLCELKLKNGCDKPLTCDAFVVIRCKAGTDLVEARGRGRDTFPAKTDGKLDVTANCTMGSIVQTSLSELKCN
jgi:hypothetical protein